MNTHIKNYYLFTLVNISEDGGLNGEHESKLFYSYEMAHNFMRRSIETEMSAYSEMHHDEMDTIVDRLGDDAVNLWFDKRCREGVLFRVTKVTPT